MFTWFFIRGAGDRLGVGLEIGHGNVWEILSRMLDSGVYLPPSQYEAAFLGATHNEEDVKQTIAAAKAAFAAMKG